jgi:2-polyprenyl-6-methoxyphenol hydroxylase-like FAD-dependent oxidoreductase
MIHKFPANLRHHYEGMRAFPEGLLVMGDAICSFNPIYGQGMTSSALQAQVLDCCLRERQTGDLSGMWRGFFRQVARVVDIPWQLAAGEDFRYPEVEGVRPRGTALINAYVAQVHRATHHDPVVFSAFLKVMNLIEPPTSLFRPHIVRRVLAGSLRRRFSTRVAMQAAQPT